MPAPSQTLSQLRRSLAALTGAPAAAAARVTLGLAGLDAGLGGGLLRAALHEVLAPGTADLPAATGFAVGVAVRAAAGRPLVWVRQDPLEPETGGLSPLGLAELGLDPAELLLVRARDAAAVLRAAAEAVRCPAVGVVVLEPWGSPRQLDLTASRRLALAAEASGVLTLLLQAAVPAPGAARTRWQVRPRPSRALSAGAPGNPAFAVELLRHKGGVAGRTWCLEWNRDRRCFQADGGAAAAPLSRPVAPLPADRPGAAGASLLRRAG